MKSPAGLLASLPRSHIRFAPAIRPVLACLFLLAWWLGGLVFIRADGAPSSQTEPAASWLNGSGTNAVLNRCFVHQFSIGTELKRVIVYYTTNSPGPGNRIPDVDVAPADGTNDWALKTAVWVEQAWRTFRAYGFGDPTPITGPGGAREFEVWIFDLAPGLGGWCCRGTPTEKAITLDAPMYAPGNDIDIETTIIHEVWHATQYYSAGWIDEATASLMQDETDVAIDLAPSTSYLGRANQLLGTPGIDLTARAYDAAYWWKYFVEQFGTNRVEPGVGVDALLQFSTGYRPGMGLAGLDAVMRARSGGTRTMASTWCDFHVANYVKDLPGTGVPPRYRYVDEMQPPGAADFDGDPATPPVARSVDVTVGPGQPGVVATASLRPWSAAYFRVLPDAAARFVNLEFRQDTAADLCWSLLLLRGGDLVREERSTGPEFSRTVVNDAYSEIVVVASTTAGFANMRYALAANEPFLRLVDPTPSQPVVVGNRTAPENFLAKVEVLNPVGGIAPMTGLTAADFRFVVGTNPAPVLGAAAYLQGQYWMIVQAPPQAADGLFPLTVSFSTLASTQPNSVYYTNRTDSDSVLVVDRSGSMADYNKIAGARNAASLYIDSWRTGDKLGVISFNHDTYPTPDLSLRDWNSTSRTQAMAVVNALPIGGATSIGDGLFGGLNQLVVNGHPGHRWAMVVLSDGLENFPRSIADYLATNQVRMGATQRVPVVHCLAIGPDANRGKLQDLAAATGGNYLYVAEPAPGRTRSRPGPFPLVDLPNDLAEYYRLAAEAVEQKQQVYSARGEFSYVSTNHHAIAIEAGASEAVFAVNWHGFDHPNTVLRRPDGVPVAHSLSNATHVVYRVSSPPPGLWRFTVAGCGANVEICGGLYLVEASVKAPLRFDLHLGLAPTQRVTGAVMPILARLTHTGPVTGALVRAEVVIPEYAGAVAVDPPATRLFELYDDGRHGDGGPHDGLYGAWFREALRPGSYDVLVTATGATPLLGSYRRQARTAFDVVWDVDTDHDGMPDAWERAHGLDPLLPDPAGDPDHDDVSNLDEYRNGTNPRNPDTDGGGEGDGSEIATGGDPQDGGDDLVRPLWGAAATTLATEYILDLWNNPYVNTAILRINADPSHLWLEIRRSFNADCCFKTITNNWKPGELFVDYDVIPGTTYYYQVIGHGPGGYASAPLGPVEVEARVLPFETELPGAVRLAGGKTLTTSRLVKLLIDAPPGAVAMRIANDSAFQSAKWEATSEIRTWELPLGAVPGAFVMVNVQFLLEDGDLSEPFQVAVQYVGPDWGVKIQRAGDSVILNWIGAGVELEWAGQVEGPWFPVEGATSPLVVPSYKGTRFYRLKCP